MRGFINEIQHEIHQHHIEATGSDGEEVSRWKNHQSMQIIEKYFMGVSYNSSQMQQNQMTDINLNRTMLSIALLIPRKDIIYDDVKIILSGLLLKRTSAGLLLNSANDQQREHFVKSVVQGLANNENSKVRENLALIINNILVFR